jgi:hypothetical protein
MTKHDLAKRLRQRQYEKGLVPKKLIRRLSDDQIIDSYITCANCGTKQVNDPVALATIIQAASSVEDFFAACDALGTGHVH